MKRVLSLLLIIMMISTGAYAQQPLYTKTLKATVTGNVSRKNIQKFYGDYALNINLITTDLKDENLSFTLLKSPKGSDKVDTVMNLASAQEGVVAAINGDFFSAYTGDQNFSLGLEIKNGELLQSHIDSNMAAGLFRDGILDFSYLEFKGEVTAPDKTTSAIAHINKPTSYYGAVLMYTPAFNGGVSPFLPEGITAVTVVDDVVTAKGVSLGGTIPIPEDGYILVLDDNMTPFLDSKFNIGDEVKVTLSTAELTENVETAFGGGTLLLKDGKKTEITHDVSGNHPRTAIGTNEDGTVVYFLTVDGRQTSSRGVSLSTLADICIEMGMVNAMNLDGGGSTAMVAKSLSNQSLHYMNSPIEKRKVINAVAITSTAQSGKAAGYIAAPASSYVLSGDSVKIHLTPYDENYNKPSDIPHSHTWKVKKGKGTVKNDVYYSSGSGKAVLELYYNGTLTDTCEITVLDEVCGIIAPDTLTLEKGKSATISGIEIFDSKGNTATVNDITLLNPEYDKKFVSLSENSVQALREGGGSLTLSYDGAKRSIKLICGEYDADVEETVTADSLYSEKADGASFDVLGFDGTDTLFDRLAFKQGVQTVCNSDLSAVLGAELLSDLTPEGVSPLVADKWNEYDHKYAKIISVDLNDEDVFARTSQWKSFSSALSGANQKNIIVLMDKKPSFTESLDSQAFEKLLQDAAKTKNVFVVYNGDENFCRIKNGVRYITVADSKDGSMVWKKMEEMKYLSFNLTENGATYCFKSLW